MKWLSAELPSPVTRGSLLLTPDEAADLAREAGFAEVQVVTSNDLYMIGTCRSHRRAQPGRRRGSGDRFSPLMGVVVAVVPVFVSSTFRDFSW